MKVQSVSSKTKGPHKMVCKGLVVSATARYLEVSHSFRACVLIALSAVLEFVRFALALIACHVLQLSIAPQRLIAVEL